MTRESLLRRGTRIASLLLAPLLASSFAVAPAARAVDGFEGDGFEIEAPAETLTVGEQPSAPAPAAITPTSRAGATLPGGGRIWVTEDPAMIDPRLAVVATTPAVVESGRLREPVEFAVYTNYASLQSRYSLLLFAAGDRELLHPIARIEGGTADLARPLVWRGDATRRNVVASGQKLLYVLRVFDAEGRVDETAPKELLLLDPITAARSELGESFSLVGDAARRDAERANYGATDLVRRTIPMRGSRIRIHGANLAGLRSLEVAGRPVPIDERGKAVAELVLPLGRHEIPLAAIGTDGARHSLPIAVDVTGKYLFAVAIADLTAGSTRVSSRVKPVANDDHYDERLFVDGRVAFYLKGKIQGRYLVTAHADTSERELDELGQGLRRRDTRTLFRRLDPDRFYPVYGDDSTTVSDVDTQGALYLRVEWDGSELLWGNYDTGITGNEFTQYNRSLYGAKLRWQSTDVTRYGEPKRLITAFGAEPESQLGHNEFLGTGGSLYFLRHTDIVQGSEKLAVEVRDRDTARVLQNITLERGRDYEIDEIQGRILLTRPLLQIADGAAPAVIRSQPLLGNEVYLVVDYEYVPTRLAPSDLTAGARASGWLGDHFQLGGTYVQETREGGDYTLGGADATLRAARGTFLHLEAARSEAVQAGTNLRSTDGGLTFVPLRTATPLDADRDGMAYGVEGRMDLSEVTGGRAQGATNVWYKRRDDAFSTARKDVETATREYGAEIIGQLTDSLSASARFGDVQRLNGDDETRAATQLDWRAAERWLLSSEVRHVRTDFVGGAARDERETDLGVRVGYGLSRNTELYGAGQVDVERSAQTPSNDSITLGGRTRITPRTFLGAEGTWGDRGHGARVGADFAASPTQQIYSSYAWTSVDMARNPGGGVFSIGQRSSLSSHLQIFGENQFFHGERQSGIGNAFGLDWRPAPSWTAGFTLQSAQLDDSRLGAVDRNAATVALARRDGRSDLSTRLEYRKDGGAVEVDQWLVANRAMWKLTEELRLLAKADYSISRDDQAALRTVGHYAETGFGFAFRPIWDDRLDVLAKYTYLYDLPTPSQVGSGPDERSHVVSLESLYGVTARWQLGGKVAHKVAEMRILRGQGSWVGSQTTLAAANVRYHFIKKWDALLEYRYLVVHEAEDARGGFLVGVYRQLIENLRLGAGYNFATFNDDLVHFDGHAQGWFVNLTGSY